MLAYALSISEIFVCILYIQTMYMYVYLYMCIDICTKSTQIRTKYTNIPHEGRRTVCGAAATTTSATTLTALCHCGSNAFSNLTQSKTTILSSVGQLIIFASLDRMFVLCVRVEYIFANFTLARLVDNEQSCRSVGLFVCLSID